MYVKQKTIQILKWACLTQEFVKLNVDGSSIWNPKRNWDGGILKDANGHMVFAFARYYGVSSNNIFKICALLYCLNLCAQMNITHIEVKIDSNLVETWWEMDGKVPWKA